MFGVLVVQNADNEYGFLGAVSGKLPNNAKSESLVPSIFDDSIDDFFINKGMSELTEIGDKIKNTDTASEIEFLSEKRTNKSIALQKWLFEKYNFLNLSRKEENILIIFEDSSNGNPPVAAGECAAPKLLQYAIKHSLKPVALAEFWWGKQIKNKDREHAVFYPACKERCRPILEYMLEDTSLFVNKE